MSSKTALPEPKTGYRHAKCYANGDENCSKTISKEHFISASFLRRISLNDTAKVAGLAWQSPQTFASVPIAGLASNILCERHNSALSRLDTSINVVTKTIHDWDQAPSAKDETVSLSGSDIERWALKCLVGLSASRNIKSVVKPECIDILFGRQRWPIEWGLYLNVSSVEKIHHTDSLLIETMSDPSRDVVLAARFYIQGLPFTLVLGKPGDARTFGVWHPSKIVFKLPNATKKLRLLWEGGRTGGPVELTRVGSYTGDPDHWHEWQKM